MGNYIVVTPDKAINLSKLDFKFDNFARSSVHKSL